ncbi:hypothetical protein PIB30_085887 [Stylosanthes scabra]|uniref:Uncharacterized protein n=1 Tax=Stylosanthes scabra TaxID=79078 RepID=A0ABU6ZRL0_9FABA|nr:hypothetical protein [Stylosanthes scabra]
MKIRQEQFFENMQNAQSQYLEELKSLKTTQDEMVNQQNNFYRQIKREQEKTIKEIKEVKKFQVNQTLMGAHRILVEKLEERVHETTNEIIEMRKQIKNGQGMPPQGKHIVVGHINKLTQTLLRFHPTKSLTSFMAM